MDRDVYPAREGDDGLPDVANKLRLDRGGARRAPDNRFDIRQHGVDSRGLAVAGDDDGYCCRKRPG
jgi:hypothetical protein